MPTGAVASQDASASDPPARPAATDASYDCAPDDAHGPASGRRSFQSALPQRPCATPCTRYCGTRRAGSASDVRRLLATSEAPSDMALSRIAEAAPSSHWTVPFPGPA